MRRTSIKKKLPKYHKVYEQIYENPPIPLYQITKNTGISRSTVSRYIIEMYDLSIMKGPFILVKPARNFHLYANFLEFEHPMTAYSSFEGFPHVVSRSLCSGSWNLLIVCEKPLDFSGLKGFKNCLVQGAKGVVCLPKVEFLNWEKSIGRIYDILSPPDRKTSLYEEISHNFWDEKDWKMYQEFKFNTRQRVMPIIAECGVRFERYQEWNSRVLEVANIETAFYPKGVDKYLMFDFLFKSSYHEQLKDILGMLPSTSIFFSVEDDYLMARLFLLNKKQKDDLFTLIFTLGEEGFFTDFYQTVVITSSTK